MHRDAFLKGAGAAVGAALIDPVITIARRVQEELAFTKVSTSEIRRLSEAAYQHARTYYQLADPLQEEKLLVDWTTAGWLLKQPQTPSQRSELSEVYARLCGVLGGLYGDRFDHTRARLLLRSGQSAAYEAGALSLMAWLLERECAVQFCLTSPRLTLELTERGLRDVGGGPTLVTARLYGRKARAQALLGDHKAARASLDVAESHLGKGLSGPWPADLGMPLGFGFSPEVLALARGEVLLQDPSALPAAKSACEDASTLLRKGVAGSGGSSSIPQNDFNLAAVLARMGEVEHACKIATDALTQYDGVGNAYVVNLAKRFVKSLKPGQATASSREFLELLGTRMRSLPVPVPRA